MKPNLAAGLLLISAVVVTVVSDVHDLDYSTCVTLDPFEAALPQTSPLPFFLNVSKTGVIHNQDSVILTIRAPDPRVEFERFLVQARDTVLGLPVGLFVDTGDADITVYNCFYRPESKSVSLVLDRISKLGSAAPIYCDLVPKRATFAPSDENYYHLHSHQNTAAEFDQEPKREARMRWMPDNNYNGTVRIIATIVQTKDIYWLRQLVTELKVYNPW